MPKKTKLAYTLLELSIVMVISSVLLVGAMTAFMGKINNAKIQDSNDRFQQIYKALGNYLLVNRRLPCPAPITALKTDANYGTQVIFSGSDCNVAATGVYQSSTSTNLIYGMVPVRDLGLPNDMAEDGYESKIIYMIDKRFARAQNATTPDFSTTTFGTTSPTNIITIYEQPNSKIVTTDAIMVLISYGANKFGSYNVRSSLQNVAPTDAHELTNYHATTTFDNLITSASLNSEVFDDVVFFKRRNDFVIDFDAMFLIACNDAGANFANANAYYGNNLYASLQCVNATAIYETKMCSKFGTWQQILTCP